VIRYRVPFTADRPGSRYKARVQFVRSIIGQGTGGTLYTTPEASLAIQFDAANLADARRELARRIRPLDPRPVRGGVGPTVILLANSRPRPVSHRLGKMGSCEGP
jgi:hypothetical protein